ncbi:carboxypeptidase-like regulatory domain-containing protein [Flavobacterium sp.]|uniref:carboxypeptidase-like regulatory domain-containing protein n=1 Tax=Flavobacterium sp. TaxID=239 RepID=UPI00262501E3|nr:carboxypeptidase-like regulatory domain-containing protein [Flavobacterium sp.]
MKKINIQIDKPCSENFNSFNKTEKGGFCNSCQKTVIDFTKMSDQEIIKYFDNEQSKTCGLFLETQLKSYSNPTIPSSNKNSNPFITSVFGLSLLSTLTFANSYSQEKTINNETINKENVTIKQDNESTDLNEKITVSGVISDESGPLPGANIYLKKYNIGVQTDIDGKFTFPKQLQIGDILIVSYVGYKTKEVKVKSNNHSITMSYDIKLENAQVIMMGEVSTNKVYKSKRTLIQKIKSLFTNE